MTDSVSSIEQYFNSMNSGSGDAFSKITKPSETQKTREPFPLVAARDLTTHPVQFNWLLENIIEQGSLNLLFGEPQAGKSLFALDWGFCIAEGRAWHGLKTKQADVIIIAGEGFAGIARRLKALEQKYGIPAPERLFISQRPAQFLDVQNVQWVADAIKALSPNPGLVIIDTLHRNMDGDENSSQDIGKFINNLDHYLKSLGAAVLIVHHSGHGDKQRSRGSSSIRAAMDAEFSATKTEARTILSCHKSKDFEALNPLLFTLTQTQLSWQDSNGEPLTSVYLEYYGESVGPTERRKLSARDEAVLTCLSDATKAHGMEPTTEIKEKFGGFDGVKGIGKKVVNIDHWREKAYQSISVDSETEQGKAEALKKAFKRSRDKLFNNGYTVEHGDYVWRIFD